LLYAELPNSLEYINFGCALSLQQPKNKFQDREDFYSIYHQHYGALSFQLIISENGGKSSDKDALRRPFYLNVLERLIVILII